MIRLTVFLLLLNFSLGYGQIAKPPSQPRDTDLDSLSLGLTGIVQGLGNNSGYQVAPNSAIESAYNNQVAVVTQTEAEAGTGTTVRRWTPQRVGQAIAALGSIAFDIDALSPATEADIALTDKVPISDGGIEKYILLSDMQDFWEAQTWTFSSLVVTTFQIGGVTITATAAELNVLDGIPAGLTAIELGYVDGVTSAIQSQIDGKQASDADLTSIASIATTDAIPYRSAADTWGTVTIGSGLTFSAGTLSTSAGGAPTDATYITQVAEAGLSAEQSLGSLATGILKNTTTTGVLSIAVAGDFPTLNQNTTGSAATLTTPREIYGNNFDGSSALTQIITSAYGGTGNGFTSFTGPTTSEKIFTLPDSSETLLYSGGALGTPSGGILTNATGLPISTGVDGLGTNVATFLATPSSVNLASAITDETGTSGTFIIVGGSPSDGYIPKWNTGGAITWQVDNAGSSFGETSLAGLANNQTLWDSASASRTLTAGLSGAADPQITFSNAVTNVSVGDLQIAGDKIYAEQVFIIPISDRITALTASTSNAVEEFWAPFAFTITDVKGTVLTAPTGSGITIDIHEAGTTIMSTDKISIDATENKSDDATTQPTLTDTSIADGAKIEFFVDAVGSTTAGAGAKVYIYYKRQ